MADGSLSQDEIDALLGGGFGDESGDSGGGGDLGMSGSDGDLDGPSSDAIAAALGQGFSPPPPPPRTNSPKPVSGANSSNLNLLMDVTMSLTVELGRTNMLIKDVLTITEGAVVELDKNVGEDVDILANGKLIGRGKIIVLDDYYAIQITHIINPMERLNMVNF
ncbi:MAG: flagellar motor switch protein FliN [Leptospiraceae bacterium]|nr:flagellar motor switch protein FliN [Leptospiraceae bacterium]MCP5512085.1 flagellar motor switch protein FliN [Leptospiraceae bacterium]